MLINNLNLQILFQLLWNLNCPSEACFFQNNSTVIFTASIILCKIDNPVSGKAVLHTWKAAQLPGCWQMNVESWEWKTEFSSEIPSYILLHLHCMVVSEVLIFFFKGWNSGDRTVEIGISVPLGVKLWLEKSQFWDLPENNGAATYSSKALLGLLLPCTLPGAEGGGLRVWNNRGFWDMSYRLVHRWPGRWERAGPAAWMVFRRDSTKLWQMCYSLWT